MSLNPQFVTIAKEFFAQQGVTAGLTGEHHTALVRNYICESIFTDYAMESLQEAEKALAAEPTNTELQSTVKEIKRVRAELYTLLYPLMNGSALRQKFEDAQILTPAAKGRKGLDANALANKYA